MRIYGTVVTVTQVCAGKDVLPRVLPHGAWRCQLTRWSRCSSSLRVRWKVILT